MDKKIEAVARALCRLDGRDPDHAVALPGGRAGFQQFVGDGGDREVPLWTTYRKEAERYVVAAEALQTPPAEEAVKRW